EIAHLLGVRRGAEHSSPAAGEQAELHVRGEGGHRLELARHPEENAVSARQGGQLPLDLIVVIAAHPAALVLRDKDMAVKAARRQHLDGARSPRRHIRAARSRPREKDSLLNGVGEWEASVANLHKVTLLRRAMILSTFYANHILLLSSRLHRRRL